MPIHCHLRVSERELFRKTPLWLLYLPFALNVFFPGVVAAQTADEYQIKAALSYNIARYTSWPSENQVVRFCIVGNNAVLNAFKAFEKKQIESLPISILHVTKITDTSSCQVLFISKGNRDLLPRINAAIGTNPVLTISEMPGFNESGGMVNLLTKDEKITLSINQSAVVKSKLKISSKLLRLAELVE